MSATSARKAGCCRSRIQRVVLTARPSLPTRPKVPAEHLDLTEPFRDRSLDRGRSFGGRRRPACGPQSFCQRIAPSRCSSPATCATCSAATMPSRASAWHDPAASRALVSDTVFAACCQLLHQRLYGRAGRPARAQIPPDRARHVLCPKSPRVALEQPRQARPRPERRVRS